MKVNKVTISLEKIEHFGTVDFRLTVETDQAPAYTVEHKIDSASCNDLESRVDHMIDLAKAELKKVTFRSAPASTPEPKSGVSSTIYKKLADEKKVRELRKR